MMSVCIVAAALLTWVWPNSSSTITVKELEDDVWNDEGALVVNYTRFTVLNEPLVLHLANSKDFGQIWQLPMQDEDHLT